MPKFFCDYCDVYLTHDSMSVRKAHNSGRNHLRNVVDYYQQIGHEKAQSVIDSITSSYAAEGQAHANPMLPQNQPGHAHGFPPPFGFPGGVPPPFPGMPGAPPGQFPQGLPPPPGGPSRGMPMPPFPPGPNGLPIPPGGLPFPLRAVYPSRPQDRPAVRLLVFPVCLVCRLLDRMASPVRRRDSLPEDLLPRVRIDDRAAMAQYDMVRYGTA
ncbi:U1 small nuclear ribonucleoprotein C [Cladobotryum mycophilum]|uniref:U1 small nuclear ribonucleoprotein C n=1 Tax=Cladobotryum mycophilum TaxID=491253 RepID=A0ABR0S5J0_9HYPO